MLVSPGTRRLVSEWKAFLSSSGLQLTRYCVVLSRTMNVNDYGYRSTGNLLRSPPFLNTVPTSLITDAVVLVHENYESINMTSSFFPAVQRLRSVS